MRNFLNTEHLQQKIQGEIPECFINYFTWQFDFKHNFMGQPELSKLIRFRVDLVLKLHSLGGKQVTPKVDALLS